MNEVADYNHHNVVLPDLIPNEINVESNGTISPTSPIELHQIILKLANKKSPGYDLMTNRIPKKLTQKVLSYLDSLYNSAIRPFSITLETCNHN